eukprot:TRINITY_DN6620_c0_g2_i5.p2 TRINITY_DN6620_c0_g2~~TRINITY_DN6620_c0_g2_i5.p2  ORF type:complete len:119 (-),score=7.06 TRINITY_DN6620_c0_g2_i5:1-357(-)
MAPQTEICHTYTTQTGPQTHKKQQQEKEEALQQPRREKREERRKKREKREKKDVREERSEARDKRKEWVVVLFVSGGLDRAARFAAGGSGRGGGRGHSTLAQLLALGFAHVLCVDTTA